MSLSALSLALLIATSATSPPAPSSSPVSGDPEQQRSSDPQPPTDNKSNSPAQPASPPNPNVDGIYHIGNGVSAPKLVYSVAPSFSKQARKKKIAGSCKVSLIVDEAGHPKKIHIVQSVAENVSAKQRAAAVDLDLEVIKALSQDRFEPATLEGKPVPVELTVEVNFQVF
jgi:hypothetical protein